MDAPVVRYRLKGRSLPARTQPVPVPGTCKCQRSNPSKAKDWRSSRTRVPVNDANDAVRASRAARGAGRAAIVHSNAGKWPTTPEMRERLPTFPKENQARRQADLLLSVCKRYRQDVPGARQASPGVRHCDGPREIAKEIDIDVEAGAPNIYRGRSTKGFRSPAATMVGNGLLHELPAEPSHPANREKRATKSEPQRPKSNIGRGKTPGPSTSAAE